MDLDAAWGSSAAQAAAPVASAMATALVAPEPAPELAPSVEDLVKMMQEMDARRVAEARIQLVVFGIMALIILHRIEKIGNKA